MNLKAIIDRIEPVDQGYLAQAAARTARLVMPHRALGELHRVGERLCAVARTLSPSVDRKAFLVAAADHGIAASGVSAYPQVVTGEMVRTFLRGGAGINVLARQVGARVLVLDAGIIPEIPEQVSAAGRLIVRKVAGGTRDFSRGPAMTREQAETSVLTGFEVAGTLIEEGADLLGTGDMGIGNTSAATAIGAVITGRPVEVMAGRGTGLDDRGFQRKCAAIQQGIAVNRPRADDPLDLLSKVGGFEIGAIAGTVLAGACHRRPVVIDGFISGAGALIAQGLCPAAAGYLFAGHRSAEQGHRFMLDHLGLQPLLDLGMRLGEGTGAALAMHVVEAGARVIREVLTFEEAGVSKED